MSAPGPDGPAPADADNHVQVRHRRLRDAAARRGVPLATILVSVAVVILAYLAGKLAYRIRDVLLMIAVAGFVCLILNPLVSAARSLSRARSAEPSPRPCQASTTVTPISAVSGWSGCRMNRHSPMISADSTGKATSASWLTWSTSTAALRVASGSSGMTVKKRR